MFSFELTLLTFSVSYMDYIIYIYIYTYVVRFTYFCEKGGGGGSELRFSVFLHEQFCVFSDDVVIFGLNSR